MISFVDWHIWWETFKGDLVMSIVAIFFLIIYGIYYLIKEYVKGE